MSEATSKTEQSTDKRELAALAKGTRFRVGARVGCVIQHRGAVVEVRVGAHEPAWWLSSTIVEPIAEAIAS